MTREEKRKILQDAVDTGYAIICNCSGDDLKTDWFGTLLSNIQSMEWLMSDAYGTEFTSPGVIAEPDLGVEPGAEGEPGVTEESPEPAPEPEPDPQPTYTKDQMVTKLTRYIDEQGVNVNAVMSEMGFAKLSQIPADRYQELLDKCEAAVEGNT